MKSGGGQAKLVKSMKELTYSQRLILTIVGAAVGVVAIAGGYLSIYKIVTLIGAR